MKKSFKNDCEEAQLAKLVTDVEATTDVFWKMALKNLNFSVFTGWNKWNQSNVLQKIDVQTLHYLRAVFRGFHLDFSQWTIPF